jgi:uncharacterized protein (DUF1501 family)
MRAAPAIALSRRQALAGAFGLGVSIDFLGRTAFAAVDAAADRRRLVVVICRGGMDGLSVAPPVGDPAYAGRRGTIAIPPFGADSGALRLDDTFGLHPSLAAFHRLALKGEARVAPAIATPDRARSHFEAQDVLENGATAAYGTDAGWLNRALLAMGPGKATAISVGASAPLILRGPIEAASWSPGPGPGADPRLPAILADLYAHDPLLSRALASGLATETMAKTATAEAARTMDAASPEAGASSDMAGGGSMMAASGQGAGPAQPAIRQGAEFARKMGATLAGFMVQPGGPQVAAVSIDGFDTHANEGASRGQLANRLLYLDAFIDGFADGMGDAWRRTALVAATEFGRTARVNGTGGTDHGTASTALVAGGALKAGGIIGDWPTLADGRLFEDRDTRPTLDMRGLFKGLLAAQFGLKRPALDRVIFPDSASVAPVDALIA